MTATPQPGTTPSATVRAVALTGFMGCGKSTVGRELASLLGWEFADVDSAIETREGRTIREIFRTDGESAFRALEHAMLKSLLSQPMAPAVIALGGGAFVQPANVELLQLHHVPTVFLDVPVDELLQRCAAEEQFSGANLRPLAPDEKSFRELHAQRLPLYRRSELIVDASRSPSHVARAIATAFALPTR
jgi:shikimate kinase